MQYETVIGLEIHVQPKTQSKMFCADPTIFDPDKPNSSISPISLGHPGTLPVLNKQAVAFGVKAALAINCQVREFSKFDRKSYFYPDLPKGYQISQYDKPLAEEGFVEFFVGGDIKRVAIERLHLEEDTAKNIHESGKAKIDFNRSGMSLMEIVTKPDIENPLQAKLFLQELRMIMRQTGVSDADMEKGQLRCDANISLRPVGDKKLYAKTEIKNINSFKAVEKALLFEQKRQARLWDEGTPPDILTTRGWDDDVGETVEQRTKEEASDYRYFPEPDIPPLHVTEDYIQEIRASLPELPQSRRLRLLEEYAFSLEDVMVIAQDRELTSYVEQVISELKAWIEAQDTIEGTADEIWEAHKKKLCKLVSGWVLTNMFKLLNQKQMNFGSIPITPENFAEFLTLVFTNKVNSTNAQIILKEMFENGTDPSDIMSEKDLAQSDNADDLQKWVDAVIAAYPDQVEEYKGGKEPVIQFLLGMVMKESKGKADPKAVKDLLQSKLV
ncbi:MAG: Asp-tRNA(Asn)/Glu-tRNA(Gln) amidotransferase subunit GatB [Patescibacteria group bacterium]